jgi:undecaprenyl-diphosphatase
MRQPRRRFFEEEETSTGILQPCCHCWFSLSQPRPARVELTTLLLFALIAGGILAFVAIAEDVTEGETRAFDQRVLLALRNPEHPERAWGPIWLNEAGRDVSALGSAVVLALLTAAVVGFLFLQHRRRLALLMLAAVVSGTVLETTLKEVFARARPELVPLGAAASTYSFPSGHSMMSAIVYLSLAALLARALPTRGLKAYVLALAMAVSVLVGISRVYLAVHWPTDVLAGWAAGAVWAILWWLLANWLERRWRAGESNGEQRSERPESEQT